MIITSSLACVVRRALCVTALAAATAVPAMAQNLVRNGGFETGNTFNIDGFTRVNPCGGLGVFLSGLYNHTEGGSAGADFNGRTPECAASLSQSISTIAGQTYNISFFSESPVSAPGNNLQLTFGGNTVFSQSINNSVFQQFFATGVATSSSTEFTVSGFTSRGTVVDDISITAAGTSTVPEPSSMALLGTGLVGLVPMIRRRRKS